MQVIRAATALPTQGRPVCAALGMFDGVHLGHQAVLRQAADDARHAGGLALAITFDRHPAAIVAPERMPAMIYPLPQRLDLLAGAGMDATLVLTFDQSLSRVAAEDFVRQLARDLGTLHSLAVGNRFTFGHRRTGNVDLLQSLGGALSFRVHVLRPVLFEHHIVSSTRIRAAIRAGQLDQAARLLGRPYSLRGRVIPGDRIGRTLGFPTANLEIGGLVLPPPGVYAAHVLVDTHPQPHPAVLNLGRRPTLRSPDPELRLEVHLLDGPHQLENRTLEIAGLQFLREERVFDSVEQLREQIGRDAARAGEVLGVKNPIANDPGRD